MEQNNQILLVKSPFRVSLFGGSTDYKGFYEQYGSFLIGTPIDKYCYISMRYRPEILSKQYLCTYSRYDLVDSIDELIEALSIPVAADDVTKGVFVTTILPSTLTATSETDDNLT